MLKFLSKILGGNKSEKDVAAIRPIVEKTSQFFQQYQNLTNDELRNKTVEFKARIKEHIKTLRDYEYQRYRGSIDLRRFLSERSEIKEDDIRKIFKHYKYIENTNEVTNEDLIELHTLIDYFYKNCK